MARVIRFDDIRPRPGATPRFEGHAHGASVSFFVTNARGGGGPRPPRHPYGPSFVIREGSARFAVDGGAVEARAGPVVVVPAGTVHGFAAGPDGMRSVNIHGSDRMVQEDLPKPL